MVMRNAGTTLTRRSLLKRTLAAGTAVALPWIIPARALGRDGAVAPSNRIVLGGIGIGPRGQYDLGCLMAEPDVQFVAISDVQAKRRQTVKHMADIHYGNKDCIMYRDMFELLARPDIDAVLIATGDRWHALAAILAAKAGKDMYCEKPCAMNIAQLQALDQTMRRYGRVFQGGTQRRSVPNFQLAAHLALSGKLGKLHTLHASVYRPQCRYDWLPAQPEPAADVVDWDRWLGPAPWRPYNAAYVGGGWRGFSDFEAGNNFLDWGAHTVDLCQWVNQADDTTPVEYETSQTGVTARYANGVKLICHFLDDAFGNREPIFHNATGTCPVRFEGDEGWVETGDCGVVLVNPPSLQSELRHLKIVNANGGGNAAEHTRNFLDCVKTRAATVANPTIVRRAHTACFAATLSWQLGRKLSFDPVKEEFVNDTEANRLRDHALRAPWHV